MSDHRIEINLSWPAAIIVSTAAVAVCAVIVKRKMISL